MCVWCAPSEKRRASPGRSWVLFPSPGRILASYLPVRSERVERLVRRRVRLRPFSEYAIYASRPRPKCRWSSVKEPDPCREAGAWRISSDFVVGHLCEAHRDRAARMEGRPCVERWLRDIGIRVSLRFPPIRPTPGCDYTPYPDPRPSEHCPRLACSAQIVSSSFDVCRGHFPALGQARAVARDQPPPPGEPHGWWWEQMPEMPAPRIQPAP